MERAENFVHAEGADWVFEPSGVIKKVNITFAAKFICILVRHCLSPTATENIVTWDRVVFVATMVTRFEVDFLRLLLAIIHERYFTASTT